MGKNLSRVSRYLSPSVFVGLLIFLSGVNSQWSVVRGFSQQEILSQSQMTTKPTSSCPTDVKVLTDLLLSDLPSYANRVIQRARQIDKTAPFSYVLVAGRPEFTPLPLSPTQSQYPSTFPNSTEQIFFTTLERQYINNKAVQMQLFHWLFITPTAQGWQLTTIFTQIGSSVSGSPSLPPRESSNGVIGQAVSLWLQDCQIGALRR